jgi:hypothetical protein
VKNTRKKTDAPSVAAGSRRTRKVHAQRDAYLGTLAEFNAGWQCDWQARRSKACVNVRGTAELNEQRSLWTDEAYFAKSIVEFVRTALVAKNSWEAKRLGQMMQRARDGFIGPIADFKALAIVANCGQSLGSLMARRYAWPTLRALRSCQLPIVNTSPKHRLTALVQYPEWYNASRRHSFNNGQNPLLKKFATCIQMVA